MKAALQDFKSVLIIAWIIVAAIFFGSAVLVVARFTKDGYWPHKIAQAWGRSILWFSGVEVSVRGLEHLDLHRAVIYMANHQSNFDIPVFLGRLPVQFRWLAKAELFKIPIFGPGMQRCGYISIDRSDRKAAFLSLKRAAAAIREGVSVLIYPEGTRSYDGGIRGFKKGGFVLAVESGVPIVPIVIRGTYPIMPRSSLRVRPGPVTLEIKPPVDTRPYSRATKDELLAHIHTIISQGFYQTP
ncbi:MAG: lysophospholipid acyltransferase family protein [Desulfobacterales bacterium]